MRPSRVLAPALLIAVLGAACAGGTDPFGPHPSDRLVIVVPETIAGLRVAEEKAATKKMRQSSGKDSYVKEGSVFALRQGKELRAVLEVIRLTADARPDDLKFRRKIADEVAGTARHPRRVGDTLVYEGTKNQQSIYTWFVSQFMHVLIVRQDPARGIVIDVDALLAEATTQLQPVPA